MRIAQPVLAKNSSGSAEADQQAAGWALTTLTEQPGSHAAEPAAEIRDACLHNWWRTRPAPPGPDSEDGRVFRRRAGQLAAHRAGLPPFGTVSLGLDLAEAEIAEATAPDWRPVDLRTISGGSVASVPTRSITRLTSSPPLADRSGNDKLRASPARSANRRRVVSATTATVPGGRGRPGRPVPASSSPRRQKSRAPGRTEFSGQDRIGEQRLPWRPLEGRVDVERDADRSGTDPAGQLVQSILQAGRQGRRAPLVGPQRGKDGAVGHGGRLAPLPRKLADGIGLPLLDGDPDAAGRAGAGRGSDPEPDRGLGPPPGTSAGHEPTSHWPREQRGRQDRQARDAGDDGPDSARYNEPPAIAVGTPLGPPEPPPG